MNPDDERSMLRHHGLRPSRARACPWTVLGQSCGGPYCVLCAAVSPLGPLRMWTDAEGRYVLTAEFNAGDLVAVLWQCCQLERTVPGLKVSATDWGRGTLLLFRRLDLGDEGAA
jgi:hypothetical protein